MIVKVSVVSDVSEQIFSPAYSTSCSTTKAGPRQPYSLSVLTDQTSTSHCAIWLEIMIDVTIDTALLAVGLSIICCLLAFNLGNFTSWLRTAWMLRRLRRSSRNMVYGGLLDMLTPNRLRAMQRLNEEVVSGSGVFYFNALWRQVRIMFPSVQTAMATLHAASSRAAHVLR